MSVRRTRGRDATIWLLVALAHVLILWWLAIGRGALPPETFPPAIDLWLAPPPGGGGAARNDGGSEAAASAPSALHRPERIFKTFPDAPVAPPAVEVDPPLVFGASPIIASVPTPSAGVSATPSVSEDAQNSGAAGASNGLGGSGRGGGQGAGIGSGRGPGMGAGHGAVLVRGPRGALITSNPSSATLAGIEGPFALLDCWLSSGDPRLQSCRVRFERPVGQGVGAEALKRSEEFYYRPPERVGRTTRRVRQVVVIALPAESDAAPTSSH